LGPWGNLYKRFTAWCASGKWLKVFDASVIEPDLEWVFIDGSNGLPIEESNDAAMQRDRAEPHAVGLRFFAGSSPGER